MEERSNLKLKFSDPEKLPLSQAEVLIYHSLNKQEHKGGIFKRLKQELNWQQHHIKLFGKYIAEPRLIDWYSEKEYRYSNKTLPKGSISESPIISELLGEVKRCSGFTFNSVLCNYYRNGSDSMSWHQDNEKELGEDPIIASLSFGVKRKFKFRLLDGEEKLDVDLNDGDLLIMGKDCQKNYKHALPKTKKEGERINLTFRLII